MKVILKNSSMVFQEYQVETVTLGNNDVSHEQYSNSGTTHSTNVKHAFLYVPITGYTQFKITTLSATYNPTETGDAANYPKLDQRSGSMDDTFPLINETLITEQYMNTWKDINTNASYIAVHWRDNSATGTSWLNVSSVVIELQ